MNNQNHGYGYYQLSYKYNPKLFTAVREMVMSIDDMTKANVSRKKRMRCFTLLEQSIPNEAALCVTSAWKYISCMVVQF